MFAHWQDHNNIVDTIRLKQTLLFPRYNLYPFLDQVQLRWMMDHQQAHNDFNNLYGLPSHDLQSVDLKDEGSFTRWLHQHWMEHVAIQKALAP